MDKQKDWKWLGLYIIHNLLINKKMVGNVLGECAISISWQDQ